MTEPDELDLIAAEYALGSLPADERVNISARRHHEPELDHAIIAWEARLAPLLQSTSPVEPPDHLLARIETSLFDQVSSMQGISIMPDVQSAKIIDLTRRIRRWRAIAAVTTGLAAAIALVFGLREVGFLRQPQVQSPTNFVALLQKDASSPAFVVSVNVGTREMTIRPVAAEKTVGKSYELWLVNKQLGAPRSLGVVASQNRPTEASLAAYSPDTVRESLFAITLEPEGGSPTGAATGPILFTGQLFPFGS